MDNINSTHPDYQTFEEDRTVCRDLMGGTKTMRDRGEVYLPKETEEDPDDYTNRLARSSFYNGFRRAVMNLVGRILDSPITVEGDPRIEEWATDVTNDGRDVETFTRDVAHTGMSEGITHIFVDYTQRSPVKNRSEEIKLSARPYMVEVKPCDLFFWEYVNGPNGKVLSEIRFRESYIEDCKRQTQVRSYNDNGDWTIYRESKTGAGTSEGWLEYESGNTGLPGIPFVTIYFGDRCGEMGATPPLLDLAHVNITHWQSSSDQRHVLHIARVPVLFTKGLKTQAGAPSKIVIGVNRHIRADDPAADCKYIEHSGAAIESGRQDLQDLEAQMASLGIELLLANRPGDVTATGRALNKKAEESTLVVMSKAIRRGLNDAFYWMEQWVDIATQTVVTMDMDHDLVFVDSGELQVLTAAREREDLSRATFWKEMGRRGILSEDFDSEIEAMLLDEAPPKAYPNGDEFSKPIEPTEQPEFEEQPEA